MDDLSIPRGGKSRHCLGISILVFVIVLWVGASFLMSYVFVGENYRKPFFCTYLNTSSFTIYLAVYRIRHKFGSGARPIPRHTNITDGASSESELGVESLPIVDDSSSNLEPLQFRETARLSLQFCVMWFLANYTLNASLSLTSVAAATVLSSTSSLWTLIIGSLVKIEAFSVMRVISVISSVAGVALVTVQPSQPDDEPLNNPVLGNLLALAGAVFYGSYVTLLKKKVGNEGRMDTVLFFGLVGLFNVCLLWPGFFILHWWNIEPFEFPPNWWIWGCLLLNSFLGTCLSEYLWIVSMLLTTPLIATMGLSLTIPLAMFGDVAFGHLFTIQFIFGALLIFAAFILTDLSHVYPAFDSAVDDKANKVFHVSVNQITNCLRGRETFYEEL
eukprot:Partr_v1_DN27800_c0_g1_i2_m67012 putative solute carrier family 35, member F5